MSNKINNITIGSDPELFLINTLDDDKVVPAYMFIKGTKEKPERITDDGFAIQYDNVAAEYNIPPCKTKEEWVNNHNFMLNFINDTIAKPNGLQLGIKASVIIEGEDAVHPIAAQFGCSPDFNAYTQMPNEAPDPELVGCLRSAGCHITIGYDNPDLELSLKLIKAMDLFLGLPSIILDKDINRKKLYGKAGCFRTPSFGVEYRVLSNFLLTSNEMMEWAWEQTMKAIEFVNDGREITNEDDIVKAINTGNTALALDIMDTYNVIVPYELLNKDEQVNHLLNNEQY